MKATSSRSLRQVAVRHMAAAVLAGGFLAVATPTFAQSDGFAVMADLPAGTACDFPLVIESRGTPNFYKEFYDKNGQVVRVMTAGSRVDYRFTNGWTQAQIVASGRGAMQKTIPLPGGGVETTMQGHSWVFLFPNDIPAGPRSTEYEGKVRFSIDANGQFRLLETQGRETDFCAQLRD